MSETLTRHEKAKADLSALLRARNCLLWIVTREERRVELATMEAAAQAQFSCVYWDCAAGFTSPSGEPLDVRAANPVTALQAIAQQEERTVYVMRDLHAALSNPVVTRTVRNLAKSLQNRPRTSACAIVILSPLSEVPPELAGHAVVIDWPLPERREVAQILDAIVDALPDEAQQSVRAQLVNGERERAIDSAIGLNAEEIASNYRKSLVTLKRVDPTAIGQEKRRVIAREKVLEWVNIEGFGLSDVGGLDGLKTWTGPRRAALIDPRARAFGLPTPRGVLLVGVPGCLHGDTPITDPVTNRTRIAKRRHLDGGPFHVWSLTEEGRPVIAKAYPVQKYDSAPMIEIVTESGHGIMVTPEHRLLSDSGWIYAREVYERLQESLPCRLATTPGNDLPIHRPDAPRCSDTRSGFQADCPSGSRSNDERLQTAKADDPGPLPSQFDVRERSHTPPRDARACEPLHTQTCLGDGLQSTPDCGSRNTVRTKTGRPLSVPPAPPEPLAPETEKTRLPAQPVSASTPADTTAEPAAFAPPSKAVSCFSCLEYTRVRSARKRESAPFYDFHVPGYNNYWACGMWHHNCGKSLTAKCIAASWQLPLLRLDFGALKNRFVGNSEERIRRAFETAESISPCVLWIDEIEKALGGASGALDGGVSTDQLGYTLTWMQEHTAPVYTVATANSIDALPPELLRAGRFDAIFFVDLPTRQERRAVLEAAFRKHRRDPQAIDLDTVAAACDGYSGAEIASIVPDAMFSAFADDARDLTTDDLLAAARAVVPLSRTASAKIAALREWARGNARPATTPDTTTAAAPSLDM